jgi:hypothetical protein
LKIRSLTNVHTSLDYHVVLITICQPFTHNQWDNGLQPYEIVLAAERDLNLLLSLYYRRHGFAGADSWLTAPLAKIGFMSSQSINDLTKPEDLDYLQSSLFLALRGLQEQGRRYHIPKTVYHINFYLVQRIYNQCLTKALV